MLKKNVINRIMTVKTNYSGVYLLPVKEKISSKLKYIRCVISTNFNILTVFQPQRNGQIREIFQSNLSRSYQSKRKLFPRELFSKIKKMRKVLKQKTLKFSFMFPQMPKCINTFKDFFFVDIFVFMFEKANEKF